MPAATVFVGTLAYRNADAVLAAIESIQKQTVPIRHVVIDDGSGDGTVERLRAAQRGRFELIDGGQNRGLVARVNQLASLVGDEPFAAWDCDDLWDADHLARGVAALERAGERAALYFSPMHVVTPSGEVIGYVDPARELERRRLGDLAQAFTVAEGESRTIPGTELRRALWHENVVPAPSVIMRSSTLRGLLPYDESLPIEDYNMWLRMSYEHDAVIGRAATVRYVRHGQNFSTRLRPLIHLGIGGTLALHGGAATAQDKAHVAERSAYHLLSWIVGARPPAPDKALGWLARHRASFGTYASALAFARASRRVARDQLELAKELVRNWRQR